MMKQTLNAEFNNAKISLSTQEGYFLNPIAVLQSLIEDGLGPSYSDWTVRDSSHNWCIAFETFTNEDRSGSKHQIHVHMKDKSDAPSADDAILLLETFMKPSLG